MLTKMGMLVQEVQDEIKQSRQAIGVVGFPKSRFNRSGRQREKR